MSDEEIEALAEALVEFQDEQTLRRHGYRLNMGPNLSQEQLERVDGHLRGMAQALAAAHATHDLSERQFHWDEYFAHEAQVHLLIPPKSDTPAPLL